jgi:hypothetical protein
MDKCPLPYAIKEEGGETYLDLFKPPMPLIPFSIPYVFQDFPAKNL